LVRVCAVSGGCWRDFAGAEDLAKSVAEQRAYDRRDRQQHDYSDHDHSARRQSCAIAVRDQ